MRIPRRARKNKRFNWLTGAPSKVAAAPLGAEALPHEHLDWRRVVVADLGRLIPEVRGGADMLKALELNQVKRLLVVLPAYDETTLKCFRNMPNVTVRTAPSSEKDGKAEGFSARDVLVAHKVLIAKDALDKVSEVWSK